MRYISTRGGVNPAAFSEILLEGLAGDGGLYVPEAWPRFSPEELKNLARLPYARLAAAILAKFAPEIPANELSSLTEKTYTPEVFGHARAGSDPQKIFPLRKLEDGLFLLELSNGPTLAFKDAAMQLLGYLLSWALEKQGQTLTILGATSGDTGSAAIYALRGKPRIKVVMLSPAGRMSDFQRAQMYSAQDDNILNIAVRGTFDDCQDLVKALNNEAAFKAKHRLGAVNSINWARVVAQAVYYVSAYLQCVERIGDPVSFAVPSGNFGNAYAGLVAKFMGVPVERIVVATNENDVLHRMMQTGVYAPRAKAQETSSPSMDITKASNFERAVFEAAGRDGAKTAALWEELGQKGRIDFANDHPEAWRRFQALGLCSTTSAHADRLRMIREAYEKWNILVDPHTADGLFGALAQRKTGERMIVLETAQAAKFSKTIKEALGFEPPAPKGFENLLSLSQKVRTIEPDAGVLKAFIEAWGSS
ncbi:MAG: threonine synthase [Alphaproteobacteria bacterium]|nr:threonine synthase [Alphaproteobacteria bacterium]